MNWVPKEDIETYLNFPELIQELKLGFRNNNIESPPKSAYSYQGIAQTGKNTFLFMPAWDNKTVFGTKLITATTHNPKIELPYIQGVYILFDAQNGKPLVGMDAKIMTNYRTAAVSALATSYLAKQKTNSLLIIGNGSLAPYFIKAHLSVKTYDTIYLWGLFREPSEKIKKQLKKEGFDIEIVDDFKTVSPYVDVISCITSATSPMVSQSDISTGQHIDLVGSFTPQMHEVTTEVITTSTVYTDNLDTTPYHAGELVKAMSDGVFSIDTIEGDLFQLCKTDTGKRKTNNENTLFKSTGMALEDLITAQLIYKKYEQTRE